jgi:lipopolysaccharide transport system ATP-binding protein
MAVRLGFAVATSFEPDILLLDEVLAVGDEGFRHKCYSRIAANLRNSAVILVTHNMDYVGHICTSALRMFKGAGTFYPDPMEAIDAYRADNVNRRGGADREGVRAFYPPVQKVDFALARNTIAAGENLEVVVDMAISEPIPDAAIAVYLRNPSEHVVMAWHTSQFNQRFDLPRGRFRLMLPLGPIRLQAGEYQASLFIKRKDSIEHLVWFWNQVRFTVLNSAPPLGNAGYVLPYQGHELQQLAPETAGRGT